MTKGRYYMHERALDCCVEIVGERDDVVLGMWVNLGYTGNPWVPGTKRQACFKNWIKLSAAGEWKDVTHLINIPRNQWPK